MGDSKIGNYIAAGLAGAVIGMCVAVGITSFIGPSVKTAKVFEEENKPNAIRLYLKSSRDQIMVEREGEYVDLSKYLESIEDKADRLIEESRIRKVVGWYSE